jgi:hypothetical protein
MSKVLIVLKKYKNIIKKISCHKNVLTNIHHKEVVRCMNKVNSIKTLYLITIHIKNSS